MRLDSVAAAPRRSERSSYRLEEAGSNWLPALSAGNLRVSKIGGCHGRLCHSTARPRDAQVPLHRPNLSASVRAQAAVGGASLHLPALATEVQDSLVGGVWADR